jgi:hypothetical protein
MSKIIQVLLLFPLILVPCVGCFGEELLLHNEKLNGSILYTLRVKGEPDTDLWKETIDLPPEGKPRDRGCSLVASDRNHKGAIALLANNDIEITLLLFDEKNQPLSILNTFDPGWLDAVRWKSAKLAAIAPNQIIVSFPNQESQSWSVVDGKIMDPDGNAFKQNTLQIGSQSSETAAQTPAAKSVPAVVSNSVPPASVPNEKKSSSIPWSIIVVLIVAATGLVWLFLKKRK